MATDTARQFRRIISERKDLIDRFPFFGRLMLHLKIGFADCKTACTDMRSIIFDPCFAERLSDQELTFVLLHELMHCVLKHCTRGKGKQHFRYNIACDIVVNSFILEIFHVSSFTVDGSEVMHLTPTKEEGRRYSADEVYEMLLRKTDEEIRNLYGGGKGSIDVHDMWAELDKSELERDFDTVVAGLAKRVSLFGVPGNIKRQLEELRHSPHTNWRYILRDFLQFDSYDYTYSRPNKRYSSDVIFPSLRECDPNKVNGIWFLVDTSGSISRDELSEAVNEVAGAAEQFNMTAKISFFDSEVTDPVEFSTGDNLFSLKPVGGGGTSFEVIFNYLSEKMLYSLPDAIVIITDGYAQFPPEEATLGVPVIWIIVDSDREPTFGNTVYISSQGK